MEFDIYGKYQDVALVITDDLLIYDRDSALKLIKDVKQGVNCHKFIISKACVAEDFFSTSSAYTIEVLQNFVNLRIRIAIVGDYSVYHDNGFIKIINSANTGDRIYFTDTIEDAVKKLEIDEKY
ncbi:MAG: DUF4180 domain-containing protein [Coprobacillus sp.]